MSLNQPIAIAVRTGKCRIGLKSSLEAVKNGEAKLVVIAANCPRNEYEDMERCVGLAGVKMHKYEGTSWDLGEAVGKPFMVSALAVIEPGDSKILKLV